MMILEWNSFFLINSVLLGVGLAMDAFSVSLANGLNEPRMGVGRMTQIAGVFGAFQAIMPMTGWVCVHTASRYFHAFERFIPWIALILLVWIGGKMILESGRGEAEEETANLGLMALLLQGVATSIDALSVGFTTAEYDVGSALLSALIIALVTFVICMAGLLIGKKFGTGLSGKATFLGGLILIIIGVEIFLKSMLG